MATAAVNNIWGELGPDLHFTLFGAFALSPSVSASVYIDAAPPNAALPFCIIQFINEEEDHVYDALKKVLHVNFDIVVFTAKASNNAFENHHLIVGFVERTFRRKAVETEHWTYDSINYLSKQNQTIIQDAYQTTISFRVYAEWKGS
jgi:hypothetical protein